MMKPHALNVDGPFYVEDGCCTACDVPRTEAPQLFAMTTAPHFHCYVAQQPRTLAEENAMLSTIACAEHQCIRYRGSDMRIVTRLSAMGEMDICDTDPDPKTELGIRNHVLVKHPSIARPELATQELSAFVQSRGSDYHEPRVTVHQNDCVFEYINYQGEMRTITTECFEGWMHFHHFHNDPGPSCYIDLWLSSLQPFPEIRWYTQLGWQSGRWYSTRY